MKDKRILAMFVTSIVAFVASLTISLGVAFALADPVAAVGLAEISYTVSTADSAKQEVVLNPVCAYNDNIEDGILVHSYDNIQYANELLPDTIKLLKVQVTNDQSTNAVFRFEVEITGETNAVDFVRVAIFDVSNPNVPLIVANGDAPQVTLNPNSVGGYIVAGYVNDLDRLEAIDYSTPMNMTITITKYGQ